MMNPQPRLQSTTLLRRGLILALVILQGILVVILLLISRSNTTKLQLENATVIMQHMSDSVLERTQRFLEPAEQTAYILQKLVGHGTLSPDTQTFERILLEYLKAVPQITGVYFGGLDGSFVFAKREDIGFSLKRIQTVNTKKVTSLQDYNQATNLIGTTILKNDAFDPRERPWFKDALLRRGLIWTDPYVFFSSKRPGVTTALPVSNTAGKRIGVIGVDIEISVASDFISSVPTSPNGSAFIITKAGEVVGIPNINTKLLSGSQKMPSLEQIGLPQDIALQKLQPTDTDLQQYRIGKKDWVGLMRPLLVNQDADWLLGIRAPKNDFVGSTENIFNQQLWQTIAVSLFVILAAIPLLWRFSRPIDSWYKRATRDELTQLLNRTEFLEQAQKSLAQNGKPSVLVLFDLDRFKSVNHIFGYEAGDKVLCLIADRLHKSVRPNDLVARFGSDDFALFLPNLSLETAQELLAEWGQESTEPFKQWISLSAGLTTVSTAQELPNKLKEANEALQHAKKTGGNQIILSSILRQ